MSVFILVLSLVVGCSTDSAESQAKRSSVEDKGQKTSVCDAYDVEEDPDANTVKVVSGGQVLHTIKLLSDSERNGFAFDGLKKTQPGFELAVEYGTRNFYRKNFIFICKDDKFYLSKIEVNSFDRQDPEKSSKDEVIRVRPNLPLAKFSLPDFMREGVVKH